MRFAAVGAYLLGQGSFPGGMGGLEQLDFPAAGAAVNIRFHGTRNQVGQVAQNPSSLPKLDFLGGDIAHFNIAAQAIQIPHCAYASSLG